MARLDRVLRAIAAGGVTRTGTGYNAPHVLDGEDVSMEGVLAHHELVKRRISGPPQLAPLGAELLDQLASGQPFTLAELPARYHAGRADPRRKRRYRQPAFVAQRRFGLRMSVQCRSFGSCLRSSRARSGSRSTVSGTS
jgi:hypothetical protein